MLSAANAFLNKTFFKRQKEQTSSAGSCLPNLFAPPIGLAPDTGRSALQQETADHVQQVSIPWSPAAAVQCESSSSVAGGLEGLVLPARKTQRNTNFGIDSSTPATEGSAPNSAPPYDETPYFNDAWRTPTDTPISSTFQSFPM
jgi:hypothetical protein